MIYIGTFNFKKKSFKISTYYNKLIKKKKSPCNNCRWSDIHEINLIINNKFLLKKKF